MLKNQFSRAVIVCIILCAAIPFGLAQKQKQAAKPPDAIARVPALDSFHEVIYQIWHEAWPNKNIAMLQKLAPEVEQGISSVAAAQLPGILREKKAVWEENVRKLQAIGSEYKAAAGADDPARLLTAAEKLHSQFEALARSIRPGLKEVDDFHSVLYMLYHHYLPANDIENIKSSAADLKQMMAALKSATLPERLKQKEQEFVAARANLAKSVEALETSILSNNEKAIKEAVSTLHTNFQALNSLFDR